MRRMCLALAILLIGVSTSRAEYLFIQYIMGFKRPDNNQSGPLTQINPNQPGSPAGTAESDIIRVPVNAVVEVSNPKTFPNRVGGLKATVKTPYGSTSLYADDQLITKIVPLPSVRQRYTSKKEATYKNRTDDRIFEFAEWCMNHALINEFAAVMDEVAASGKATGLDKLDKAVEAYTKVKAALAQRIDKEEASNYWRGRLGFRISQSDHYSLLYNAAVNDPEEVQRRLKMLEENMKAVYYWFALRGIALNMPEQKLVCVLLDQPEQFRLQRQLIEDEPLVTDGFFSARDNVVVFSAQRLDDASMLFSKQMQANYQKGWDRAQLLQGKGNLAGSSPDEQYRMQTWALLDKAMEVEGERAAVTHEGTRQILVGCGLQKPTCVMPDWLQFGMASVFETPKGAFELAPPEVCVAYWPGYGAPSWAYNRIFKLLERGHMPGSDILVLQWLKVRGQSTTASDLLKEVVTDTEFSRARDYGARAGKIRLLEARTRAWALCYYLSRIRTPGVIRLYEELAKLPRDMEPEPTQVLACFCRAFDVADVTGTKPNPAEFEKLATDWLGFMASVRNPGADFNLGVQNPGPNPGTGPGGKTPPGKGGGKGP
jgi:uncharacterized protein DUF1570